MSFCGGRGRPYPKTSKFWNHYHQAGHLLFSSFFFWTSIARSQPPPCFPLVLSEFSFFLFSLQIFLLFSFFNHRRNGTVDLLPVAFLRPGILSLRPKLLLQDLVFPPYRSPCFPPNPSYLLPLARHGQYLHVTTSLPGSQLEP